MFKINSLLIIGILILFFTGSCKKLVEIDPPINALTKTSVFSNDLTAQQAVSSFYIRMMQSSGGFANSLATEMFSISSDELNYSGTVQTYQEFYQNAIGPNNSVLISLWGTYGMIYQANLILENTQNNAKLSPALVTEMQGTAKFIRAFYYFYLINEFGDVPLVLSSDYTQTKMIPRTPIAAIYQQIISDLQDAENLLQDYDNNNKALLTKWAAKALLARVYLYQNDWQNAAIQSSELINAGIFHLEDSLNNVFLASSSEAIWQLSPVTGYAFTWEGNAFVPGASSTSIPTYYINDNLINSFEPNDLRKTNWIGTKVVNNTSYYYPNKYKISNGSGTATEYYMVLRLGEQYLINAEAEAELSNLSEALSDLDSLRYRAGLPFYNQNGTEYTQSQVLTFVELERQHELFCEWGHRWFDLKRTGRSDAVLKSIKSGWKSTDIFMPLPLSEINANPSLIQNEGY